MIQVYSEMELADQTNLSVKLNSRIAESTWCSANFLQRLRRSGKEREEERRLRIPFLKKTTSRIKGKGGEKTEAPRFCVFSIGSFILEEVWPELGSLWLIQESLNFTKLKSFLAVDQFPKDQIQTP
ncbi:hypothetical protein VNO77_34876 [Canavalia gladiata]|uniref:Uncharacterized protein n=1 Tax=Canavalia gladiata TaxID=3824 RepID=A0AAN9Q028_CANGL